MTNIVINVENLGKKYKIGSVKKGSLRESFTQKVSGLFSKNRHAKSLSKSEASGFNSNSEFWALNEINFEVKKGEAVGIVGRNGAGKSTLLKILSQITKPSTGRFEIFGRVSSLLEVGTGFHEELTGRENVFLNGTILGMKRQEVRSKFDEIVAFSGVEKFIDTPVKHYSSGMKVRLAFSVAAFLEPEILIIDEVLAVGDAEFQKKCLGKMEDVTGQGRTVLFVSHNMEAVRKLCSSGILLKNGTISFQSQNIDKVVKNYFQNNSIRSSVWLNSRNEYANDYFEISEFGIYDELNQPISSAVENDQDLWVGITINLKKYDPSLELGYNVTLEDGQILFWSYFYDSINFQWENLRTGTGKITLKSKLPKRLFNNGVYSFNLIAGLRNINWSIHPQLHAISIDLAIEGKLSESLLWNKKRTGHIAPVLHWEVENVESILIKN